MNAAQTVRPLTGNDAASDSAHGATSPGVLLVMDFQHEIVARTAKGGSAKAVERASVAVAAARRQSMPLIFVRVAFRHAYRDVAATNLRASALKQSGLLLDGTTGAEIVPELRPDPGEPVVTKRRVGALAYTDLPPLLSALGAQTLVLAGLATSGVVLSTVRHAADADFRICVLEDACADADADVHRMLMAKIFPTQATVLSVDDFLATTAKP
jgi:nicotinamidase-related amidase